jgi:hypothetical protein
MKMQWMIKLIAILVFASLVACSQASVPALAKDERPMMSHVVAGSYIVKAPGDGEQAIRSVFKEYGVELVRALGNEQYELRLSRDPGMDVLNKLVTGSDGKVKAIQPNFVYHSF